MEDHPDSFFVSLRPLFLLGQVSAVLPISGVRGKNHTCLKFSWKNWQQIYVLLVLFTTFYINVISTVDNLEDGIRLDNFGSTVFFTVCILNSIFFVSIARDLPALCRYVAKVQVSNAAYGFPNGMKKKINKFIFTFISFSIVEHSLLVFLNARGALKLSEKTGISFLDAFYSTRFPLLLQKTGYSYTLTIFFFFIHVICTLNWNYLDLFLSALGMQLSASFADINAAISVAASNSIDDVSNWRKLSSDYNKLAVLTKTIGKKVTTLVLVSYISNLYHLSLQLLRSLKLQGDTYSRIYFYFSMGYLMLRMLTVSYTGTKIVDESKASKEVLFALNNPCESASRLLDQILTDDISFTGNKFFSVDRRLIVTIIGTLVTYEVVLLQLNSLHYID